MIIRYNSNAFITKKQKVSESFYEKKTLGFVNETKDFQTDSYGLIKDSTRTFHFNNGGKKPIFSVNNTYLFSNSYNQVVKKTINEVLNEDVFETLNILFPDCDNDKHTNGFVVATEDLFLDWLKVLRIGECGCYNSLADIGLANLVGVRKSIVIQRLGISKLGKRLKELQEARQTILKNIREKYDELESVIPADPELNNAIKKYSTLLQQQINSFINRPPNPTAYDLNQLDKLNQKAEVALAKVRELNETIFNQMNQVRSTINDLDTQLSRIDAERGITKSAIDNPSKIEIFFPTLTDAIATALVTVPILTPKTCGWTESVELVGVNVDSYAELNPETCECSVCPPNKFLCKSRNPTWAFQWIIGQDFSDTLSYCMDGCCGGSLRYYNPFTDSCGCACGNDIITGELLPGGSDAIASVDGVFKVCFDPNKLCATINGYEGTPGICVSKATEDEAIASGKKWNEFLCDFIEIESSSSSSSSSSSTPNMSSSSSSSSSSIQNESNEPSGSSFN